MVNAVYGQTPLLGCNLEDKTTTAQVGVGTIVQAYGTPSAGYQGKWAMYIRALTAIPAGDYVTVDMTTVSMYGTTVTSGTSSGYFQNGSTAFVAAEYGWVYATKTRIPVGNSVIG